MNRLVKAGISELKVSFHDRGVVLAAHGVVPRENRVVPALHAALQVRVLINAHVLYLLIGQQILISAPLAVQGSDVPSLLRNFLPRLLILVQDRGEVGVLDVH